MAVPTQGTMRTPSGGAGDGASMPQVYGGWPGSNQYTGYFGGGVGSYMPGNTPFPGGGGNYGTGGGSPYYNPVQGTMQTSSGYNPYQIPQYGSQGGPQGASGQPWSVQYTGAPGWPAGTGLTPNPGSENIGHSLTATGLQFPGLSTDFAQYLQSQIGQGLSPFNLSTMLPTGGMTAQGQLSPGLDPVTQQLQNLYSGGYSSVPGSGTLSTIANQGISALPEWQAMIQAMNQNVNTGAADLKEQLGYMGNIAGSPMASGMSQYYNQAIANQNSLLGQLQQQNILQGQIPAAEQLLGGAQATGQNLYGYDVNAINNMYQAYMQGQPQYNPMLSYIGGLATMYPPTNKTPGFGQQFSSALAQGLGSGIGGMLSKGATFGSGGVTVG